jgi:hypothetical protein
MPSTLEEAFLQKNPKKKLVIGVAIDGSNISDKALATACAFYNAARGDRLVILHVSDSTKTFLPRHLQPKHLESQYVDKAHSLKVGVQPGALLQLPSIHSCNQFNQISAGLKKHACSHNFLKLLLCC